MNITMTTKGSSNIRKVYDLDPKDLEHRTALQRHFISSHANLKDTMLGENVCGLS